MREKIIYGAYKKDTSSSGTRGYRALFWKLKEEVTSFERKSVSLQYT